MTREAKIAEARVAYDAALKEQAEAWNTTRREAIKKYDEEMAQARALPTVDQQCRAMVKALRRYDQALETVNAAHMPRIRETHEALLRACKDDAEAPAFS